MPNCPKVKAIIQSAVCITYRKMHPKIKNHLNLSLLLFQVKVFWTADDLKGTGWHEGWYMAVVTDEIDEDSGTANIIYVVEPSESYKVSVEEMLQKGWIKIDDRDEIEQFYEIGARIKIKWSKEEIGDTDWRPGWYVAEVQDADRDNDEITVQFVSEPECTYKYEVTPRVAQGTLQMVKPVL